MAGNKVVQILMKKERITVTLSSAGAAVQASTNKIYGEILKIVYDKSTGIAAQTTATLTFGTPAETLDAYDVNTGDASRYVRAVVQGGQAGDNKWTKFVVDDYVTVTVLTGQNGGATGIFYVDIYYR